MTLKRTTELDTKLSYLDVSISIRHGKFVTEVYDKSDSFNFNILNYPFMCSNIPARPTYGVNISQLIRMKSTKVQTLRGIWWKYCIFGLKTPLHAYV